MPSVVTQFWSNKRVSQLATHLVLQTSVLGEHAVHRVAGDSLTTPVLVLVVVVWVGGSQRLHFRPALPLVVEIAIGECL